MIRRLLNIEIWYTKIHSPWPPLTQKEILNLIWKNI